MTKTFCPLPWIHFSTRPTGTHRVCCQANMGESRGIFKDDKGHEYNLGQDKITDSRNCQEVKDIRAAMLKGEWHPACTRCQQEEQSKIISRRQHENRNWADAFTFDDAENVTNPDGTVIESHPIYFFDLRFGNKCNLKCRMCGPTDSDQWYDDYVATTSYTEFTEDTNTKIKLIQNAIGKWQPVNDIYNWHEQDDFWLDLDEHIPNMRKVYFAGGEPLLIDAHYDFLSKCIHAGQAHHMQLSYNTNITILPKRVLNLWPKFKKVKVNCSVDGIGQVNDYVRFPSKWSVIESNLKKADQLASRYPNIVLGITPAVSIYNVMHYPDLIHWFLTKRLPNFDMRCFNPHLVHVPEYLNIAALPPAAKELVKSRLESYIATWDQTIEQLHPKYIDVATEFRVNILDGYISYMMGKDLSDHLPYFIEFTEKLDKKRNQSFKELEPNLWDLIQSCS